MPLLAVFALPWWTVLPFVLLLLAIAVLPLVAGHFWHKNRNKALVAAILALPIAAYFLVLGQWKHEATEALFHGLEEYGSFIVLLFSLYTVSGGIVLKGDIEGRPLTNTLLLAFGAALTNLAGTTGASMLLIRPFLRINQERHRTHHLPIFFIFIVSNVGGLLTPLGDPPLFLGFLRGVEFFWTLTLWRQWLLVNGLLLLLFFIWDTIAYRREKKRDIAQDVSRIHPLRVGGLINVVFLVGILGGVLAQSEQVMGQMVLEKPWGEIVMLLMAAMSWVFTPGHLRHANRFTWHPIIEVAVLFAGIFVTMVPALEMIKANQGGLQVTQPWQYFWLTGGLSSFLDNAPTYLVFASMAARSDDLGKLMHEAPVILTAISCGAVFMGANTYIGNGPNFMVKAIADEVGFRTPSFFGYMLYSGLILLPIFGIVTAVFFVW